MNLYQEENFDRTVYIIEDGEIIDLTFADLCKENRDETTTPNGVDARFHLRGRELWSWGVSGQDPKLVHEFDSEKEAVHGLLLTYRADLWGNADAVEYFESRVDAQKALEQES